MKSVLGVGEPLLLSMKNVNKKRPISFGGACRTDDYYYYLELTLAFGGQSIASQQSLSSVVFSAQIDAGGVALGSHHCVFLSKLSINKIEVTGLLLVDVSDEKQ